MDFNFEDYTDINCVMHCPEEWMAEVFCDYMHEHGREWCSGQSYKQRNLYETNKENTVYAFNQGKYGNLHYHKSRGDTILEFSDFFGGLNSNMCIDNSDAEKIDAFLNNFTLN